jgi:hypothetical protein
MTKLHICSSAICVLQGIKKPQKEGGGMGEEKQGTVQNTLKTDVEMLSL